MAEQSMAHTWNWVKEAADRRKVRRLRQRLKNRLAYIDEKISLMQSKREAIIAEGEAEIASFFMVNQP